MPRYRRPLAAAACIAGFALFAVSLLALAVDASRAGPETVTPIGPYVGNGTATYILPLPFGSYSPDSAVTGSWSFPKEAGRFLVVPCEEVPALERGNPIADPVRADPPASSGTASLRGQDLFFSPGRRGGSYCGPDVMALQWPAGADATLDEPFVSFTATPAPFGSGGVLVPILLFGGIGVVLVGAGSVVWLADGRHDRPDAAEPHESTAETLLQLTDRSIGWLERMRRYLLLGGVLGIFLWYPVLLGLAWALSVRAGATGLVTFSLVLLVLAFLAVLTVVWAREYVRLDRELAGWRERLERLKRREEEMMERFANL